MAPLRFLTIWLFLFLHPSVRCIEATAAVSFQFIQFFASVKSSLDEFTSQLSIDLQTKYSFTSQHIKSVRIFSSPGGRIQVTFDLDIDTRNRTLVAQRDILDRDLIAPNYVFVFTNSTGANEAFLVDGSSASVTPSFWDGWHQYAPDILYAMLVGLVLFALFCSAVYCLVAKQKRAKKSSAGQENRMAPPAGHLNGIENEGYVVEMTQVYRVKNTESSPIPQHPSSPKEISVSVIAPTTPETTEPQSPKLSQSPQRSSSVQLQQPTESQLPILDHIPELPAPMNSRRSVTTSESPTLNTFMPAPSPSIMRKIISTYKSSHPTPRASIPKQTPSSSSSQRSQQLDLATLDVTVTPTESPTYSAEKPPTLNRVTAKMASLQGSVRSSILGFSTSTTPTSSRRPSITGPSIYARLLYASYSVPPKKIYDYI
ncbi:uncharacterized protein LOC752302 [Strongylocentrotus purpuratus]|uniref:Uncharacterized protein n=1 Tax=Strongylocentrotus purpuratus TaxID=7668 RepID=A0A7M7LIK6_STRPU|nr:uncharacterized protein LOC752302 [Strongylocentrotus purpuratus]